MTTREPGTASHPLAPNLPLRSPRRHDRNVGRPFRPRHHRAAGGGGRDGGPAFGGRSSAGTARRAHRPGRRPGSGLRRSRGGRPQGDGPGSPRARRSRRRRRSSPAGHRHPRRHATASVPGTAVPGDRTHRTRAPPAGARIAALAWAYLSPLDRAKLDTQRAVALAHLGRYQEAVASCDRALQALVGAPGTIDDRRFLAGGLLNRGLVHAYRGDWDAAPATSPPAWRSPVTPGSITWPAWPPPTCPSSPSARATSPEPSPTTGRPRTPCSASPSGWPRCGPTSPGPCWPRTSPARPGRCSAWPYPIWSRRPRWWRCPRRG